MKHESANGVEKNSSPISIQGKDFAEKVVLENITVSGSREEKVYDLYVEGVHEYFANGILVHNCIDASRYVVLMKILGGVLRGVNLNKIASLAGR